MGKLKNVEDLRRLQAQSLKNLKARVNIERADELPQIKIAMATCCIASGAREVMNHIVDKLNKMNIEAIVTQTGCMGYCYAEPTIEVKLPGKEPVVFGYVDTKKADEIIEKYIKNEELVDGIIPVNYETI